MKRKMKAKNVIITNCSKLNPDFWRLYRIFSITICPGMDYRMFEAYYKSERLQYLSVTFFYAGDDEVAGFCAAAFYSSAYGKKSIARSATGFLPEYRGQALSKWKLYNKYMSYKLRHPTCRLILTVFAGNPYVYSMMCKYTHELYPRYNVAVPEKIVTLKDELLKEFNLTKRELEDFVVKINFEVEKSEEAKASMRLNANNDIQFYISKTQLKYCTTLLVVIPVSLSNVFGSLWLIIKKSFANIFPKKKNTVLKLTLSSE